MELLLLSGSDIVKLCLSDTHYKPTISLTKGDLTISAELTDDDMDSLGMGGPDVDDLEEQIEELKKQVSDLEDKLSDAISERDDFETQLDMADDEITALKEQIVELSK